MQEINSQQGIMTAFMEEMKQQSQSILENLRERGQSRLEVASKPERQFSNEGGGGKGGYEKVVNFTVHLCR